MTNRFSLLIVIALSGCVGIPEKVEPVRGFELNRYLGTWYEIARFDHSFERGLEKVTATYTKRDDDGINVLNRGYNPEKKEWKEATGRAYFVDEPTIGRLKVSFFRPFYAGYNIIDLDAKEYRYSLVCGPNRSYLWILSRTPTMEKEILDRLVRKAAALGFATENFIYVRHETTSFGDVSSREIVYTSR